MDRLFGAYLQRLGFFEKPQPTLDTLIALHKAHVCRIPYENLDILSDIPIDLTPRGMVEKVALRHAGGYCFELNGAFGYLLRHLGFEVHDSMGRFWQGETAPVPMRRHRVLRVRIADSWYLCDVGVGIPAMREPVKIEAGLAQEQDFETYRIELDEKWGYMLFQTPHGKEERAFFSFTEEPQEDVDFVMPSFYCEKHPDSPFNKTYMLAIKTPDGRKTLDGMDFKIFTPDNVTVRTLTEAELPAVLRDHFGLTLSQTK